MALPNAILTPRRYNLAMNTCALTVLVKPGAEPIRCRRKVWEDDPASGVCYACHPRGRDQAIERVVRRVLKERGRPAWWSDERRLNKLGDRRVLPADS